MAFNSFNGLDGSQHFWVPGGPFFSSALLLSFLPISKEIDTKAAARKQSGSYAVPASTSTSSISETIKDGFSPESYAQVSFRIFDVDGAKSNEAHFQFPDSQPRAIELAHFTQDCKSQAGFQHIRLQVDSDRVTKMLVRVQKKDPNGSALSIGNSVALMGQVTRVDGNRNAFLPVSLAQGRFNMLGCINLSSHDSQLRIRLFCGKRSPETTVSLPAGGSRVVILEQEFKEFSFPQGEEVQQAYIRLTCRPGSYMGVQLLDHVGSSIAGSDTDKRLGNSASEDYTICSVA